jgi:hypothetical protein
VLTIRHEQMAVLREIAIADFRRRLYDHIAPLLRGSDWTADRIWAQVDTAMNQAREFHLVREIDVARFAGILCTHIGEIGVARLPKEAVNILNAYGTDPGGKLAAFEYYLRHRSE